MTFLDWSESQELWQLTTVLNQSLFFITKCCKKVSTIYTDIDYIYTYMHQLKKKQLQTIKQLSSLCICRILRKKPGAFSRSECGALQRGSKNEPFNCGMCGTVGKTRGIQWGKPMGKTPGKIGEQLLVEDGLFDYCLGLVSFKIRWGDLNMF